MRKKIDFTEREHLKQTANLKQIILNTMTSLLLTVDIVNSESKKPNLMILKTVKTLVPNAPFFYPLKTSENRKVF